MEATTLKERKLYCHELINSINDPAIIDNIIVFFKSIKPKPKKTEPIDEDTLKFFDSVCGKLDDDFGKRVMEGRGNLSRNINLDE